MKNYHTILIGGGINNLVTAALLAKAGKSVLILEKTQFLGGCIRSEELEGCIVDTLSTAYPLFVTSPGYGMLKDDLEKEGIKFVATETPTATVLDDNSFAIIRTDKEKNKSHFNDLASGDGDAFRNEISWVEQHSELLFTFLGKDLISKSMVMYLAKYIWKTGIAQTKENVGQFTENVRNNFSKIFKGNELKATLAPWVLHTGLSPDSPFSATMAKIIAFTLELVSLPMVEGGSYKIVDAFKNIIEKNGGEILLNTEVSEIVTDEKSVAKSVKTKDGKSFSAKHFVASMPPNLLYGKLLNNSKNIPSKVKSEAENFRFGMGNMQIHLVLNEAPKWFNQDLEKVTYVHLTNGTEEISQAVSEAKSQYLPKKCTIAIGQPTATDPTRGKDGKHVLWIQIPDCPNFPKKDASGELNHLCNGEWTEELKNAYADKIQKRISQYISNVESACINRKIVSPKDLGELNINLVNGDPYSGLCEIEQYLMFRPLKSTTNHNTPLKNLYHSGASTHPGPGLSGGAGFLVAQNLLKK